MTALRRSQSTVVYGSTPSLVKYRCSWIPVAPVAPDATSEATTGALTPASASTVLLVANPSAMVPLRVSAVVLPSPCGRRVLRVIPKMLYDGDAGYTTRGQASRK